MSQLDRRDFVGTLSMAGLAGLTRPDAGAPATAERQDSRTVDVREGVTTALAKYVIAGQYSDLPAPVLREARRTLLNWVGCAIGGSRHESIHKLIAAVQPFGGPAQAQLLGRPERFDVLHAALIEENASEHLPAVAILRMRPQPPT